MNNDSTDSLTHVQVAEEGNVQQNDITLSFDLEAEEDPITSTEQLKNKACNLHGKGFRQSRKSC